MTDDARAPSVTMPALGDHAIVIGASMAGLLAARALADYYNRVTLLERDTFPDTIMPRKGVPQGRHLHVLLARGQQVIEELLPGLSAELINAGAWLGDASGNVRWFLEGDYQCQPESGLMNLAASRPFLEGHVRARVLAISNVRAIEDCDVAGLEMDAAGRRVIGARVRQGSGTEDKLLSSDMVVDATGRGSRLPAWLTALGYAPPAEERVEVRLGYATQTFRYAVPPDPRALAVVNAQTGASTRGAFMAHDQGERWTVTLVGYLGDYPPVDEAGFRAFAASLPAHEISALADHGEPLSAPVSYRFPASQRRRYERLASFPEGLLALGDALCSFNPAYGQGMSVAALEALALGACLAAGADRLAPRFFARAASIIDAPWRIVVGGDLRFPEVEGSRGPLVGFLNWYLRRLHHAGRHDPEPVVAFQKVATLMAEPSSLLRPRIVWRVLQGNLRSSPPRTEHGRQFSQRYAGHRCDPGRSRRTV